MYANTSTAQAIRTAKNKGYIVTLDGMAYWKFGDSIFNSKIEIRHKDGDSKNNHWDNILLGSRSDNQLDICREFRVERAKKASNAARKVNEKLTPEQVVYIRQEYINGKSLARLAYEFDMVKSSMSLVVNRKTYKNI